MEQLLFQRQNKLMLSPVLAALLEVPTSRVDLELVRLNGCPSALLFLCPLVRGMLGVSVHSQQTEPYVFTHMGVCQRLLHLSSASAYLGLSTVFHGHLGTEWPQKFGIWSLSDGWKWLQDREKSLCNSCEMVPGLKAWNWNWSRGWGAILSTRFIRRTSGYYSTQRHHSLGQRIF